MQSSLNSQTAQEGCKRLKCEALDQSGAYICLDGGNSVFVNRVLVEMKFEASKTLYLKARHFRASKIALTKARLLNHDLHFHVFGQQNINFPQFYRKKIPLNIRTILSGFVPFLVSLKTSFSPSKEAQKCCFSLFKGQIVGTKLA